MSDDDKKKSHPAILVGVMVVAGIVIVGVVIWVFTCCCDSGVITDDWCSVITKHPPWTVLAGLATAPALLLTWIWREQHKRASEEHADAQIRHADAQMALAQDGQVTERFTRAIEQLGSDKLAVRLGAIFALERIAKDSRKDHWTIIETLAAHAQDLSTRDTEVVRQAYFDTFNAADRVRSDLQAVLTVIGRRIFERDPENAVVNLSGVIAYEANLRRAFIERVNLSKAVLTKADLTGARLRGTNLTGAKMTGCDFTGANLCFSNLESADLSNADFFGADLAQANFRKALLGGADLGSASGLTHEQLQSAIISHDTKLPPEFADLIPPAPKDED